MPLLDDIKTRVRAAGRRILLCETRDDRVMQAAARMARERFCRTVILGEPAAISRRLRELAADPATVDIIDPADKARQEEFVAAYTLLRRPKGMT